MTWTPLVLQIFLTCLGSFLFVFTPRGFYLRWWSFYRDLVNGGQKAEQISLWVENLLYSPLMKSQVIPLKFKHYSELIVMLQEQRFQKGVSIQSALAELLLAFAQEKEMLECLKKELFSSLAQFFIISAVTWGFVFSLKSIVQVSLEFWQLALIAFMEVIGLLLFLFVFFIQYERQFFGYSELFQQFYLTRSWWSANLALNQIHHHLNFDKLKNHSKFVPHLERLTHLLELAKKFGQVKSEHFSGVISGLWSMQFRDCQSFVQIISRLKFVIIVLFFVSSYLLITLFLILKMNQL
jgi:hypothetical protein